jgi:hypothetical protein
MISYPIQPHRRHRRQTARQTIIMPPANIVSVFEVIVQDATTLLWVVSSIVIGEPADWSALEANDQTALGWVSPAGAENNGEASFIAHYVGTSFDVATTWRMLTQPAGLVFPDGDMNLPQSGTVS